MNLNVHILQPKVQTYRFIFHSATVWYWMELVQDRFYLFALFVFFFLAWSHGGIACATSYLFICRRYVILTRSPYIKEYIFKSKALLNSDILNCVWCFYIVKISTCLRLRPMLHFVNAPKCFYCSLTVLSDIITDSGAYDPRLGCQEYMLTRNHRVAIVADIYVIFIEMKDHCFRM